MRRDSGGRRGAVAAFAAIALVVLTPGMAASDELVENPVGAVVDGAREQVGRLGGGDGPAPAPAPTRVTGEAPRTTSDDDSEGHETEDPQAPDHGGATVLQSEAAGEDVATVGGLVFAELGRLPRTGDAVIVDGWRFVADLVIRRRVRRVGVWPPVDPAAEEVAP